jgi:serine/threonine-protein kinase
MHSQSEPVLHRDIKPSNIKLAPSGLIKLVDFGLVKLMSKDASQTITVLQGRGTAAYTPLEQYGEDDSHTDIRSDIYSLGATLYHLLTNVLPAEAKQRFLKPGAMQRPTAINTGISPSVEQGILAAISMHPDDRPGTVTELRDLLFADAPSAVIATQSPQNELVERGQFVHENRLWFALAGGATLLALLITLIRQ